MPIYLSPYENIIDLQVVRGYNYCLLQIDSLFKAVRLETAIV